MYRQFGFSQFENNNWQPIKNSLDFGNLLYFPYKQKVFGSIFARFKMCKSAIVKVTFDMGSQKFDVIRTFTMYALV